MSNILQLNQSQIFNGLGTLTYTVPATILNGPAVSNVIFNVACQSTFPSAVASDGGAGSGRDLGLGVTGGFPGASQVQQTVSNGQTGLGTAFPNMPASSAPGVNPTTGAEANPNLPSVALGSGVTGLASGGTVTDNAAAPIGYTAVTSSLSIVVNQNGSPVYTSTTPTATQSSLQFKVPLLCNAGDVITVVLSSANANDAQLNSVRSNIFIGQGS